MRALTFLLLTVVVVLGVVVPQLEHKKRHNINHRFREYQQHIRNIGVWF